MYIYKYIYIYTLYIYIYIIYPTEHPSHSTLRHAAKLLAQAGSEIQERPAAGSAAKTAAAPVASGRLKRRTTSLDVYTYTSI